MPRTKGSKNRPKTNITKDYASQIAQKQETIASLNTEIASITANIDTMKADVQIITEIKEMGKQFNRRKFVECGIAGILRFKKNGKYRRWLRATEK